MTDRKIGLVIGKFYPPHVGHHYLIDTALSQCEKVYVGVCWSSVESVRYDERAAWLRDRHPDVQVFPIHDESPVNYTDETWGLFLDALVGRLETEVWWDNGSYYANENPAWPDTIFSGEDYVPEFAQRLTERYKTVVSRCPPPKAVGFVKLDRTTMPGVSATEFRKDPAAHWDLLAPATRAGLCKRVVICGAESSGTTTLAKDLAERYKTTVVPEYGRHFDWAVGKHHTWTADDFYHIAHEQKRWEDKLARRSENGLLICDTDEYATAMFSEVYLGEALRTSSVIAGAARAHLADLYIITSDKGIEFEDDGTRYNSGRRPWMTGWFCNNLPVGSYVVLEGDRESRLWQAAEIIDRTVLHWELEDPIEKRVGYEYDGIVQSANAPA